MRQINGIIVHCSATRAGWMAGRPLSEKVAEIRRWHVDGNGWADIGYHWIVDRDGRVAVGRPVERSGAHVKGHNADTIGICLLGGHGSAADDLPGDHFTPDQLAALRKLINDLMVRFGPLNVTGHNQYANKACPGFNVPKWWAAVNLHDEPPRTTFWQALAEIIKSIFRRKA